jgi:hypothetical protein
MIRPPLEWNRRRKENHRCEPDQFTNELLRTFSRQVFSDFEGSCEVERSLYCKGPSEIASYEQTRLDFQHPFVDPVPVYPDHISDSEFLKFGEPSRRSTADIHHAARR